MRLAAYVGASAALAGGVVLKALHQRANFYAACVYLSQSSANLMILTNFILVVVGFALYGLQRFLYGPLRPIETEQLYEKAWFAVTETCLAMTIFRGEVGGWFLVMFVCLLAGKVWGWIGEGRVEILEQQPPANPLLFHSRLAVSLALSVLFDAFLLDYAVRTVLAQARPDMMVMFGFEFAILLILSSSTASRYILSLVEVYITRQQRKAKIEERRREIRAAREDAVRQQANSGSDSDQPAATPPDEDDIDEMDLDIPGWEEKGRWVFYLDLVTDFLKLVVYLSFFAILFTFYGLPIHILRDVVLTMRSFIRRVSDFIRYRNATRDMNERYPDATSEEIAREDVCIICREDMVPWQQPAPAENAAPRPPGLIPDRLRPKKLPCGHILHLGCLRSWLERQQNCPTCRRPVLQPTRIFATGGGNNARGDAAAGQPGNAPGAHQGGAANAAPADGQPRARIFNFGPIRIGFGAGRGDLLQNLAQQIHDGNAPPAPAPNGNDPVGGAQQIGFGFGFGRPRPQPAATNPPPQSNPTNIQSQLQNIEQQINQEIRQLRLATEQLNVVRGLQTELVRLRAIQNNPPNVPRAGQTNLRTPPFPPTNAGTHPPPAPVISRQFTSSPQVPAMRAGDTRLPDGLTLPDGWSLLPLHPVNHTQPGQSQPGQSQPNLHVPVQNSAPIVGGRAANVGTPLAVPPTGPQVNSFNNFTPTFARTPPSTDLASPRLPESESTSMAGQASERDPSEGDDSEGAASDHDASEHRASSLPDWSRPSLESPTGRPDVQEHGSLGEKYKKFTGEEEESDSTAGPSTTPESKGKSKVASVEDYLDDDDDEL